MVDEIKEEVLERPGGYPTLAVPKNEQGKEELLLGLEGEDNIRWCSLRDEESESLTEIYDELNSALGIVLDRYEEEEISAGDAPKALEIVRRWQEHPTSDVQTAALGKLQRALEAAIQYGTYVELSL